MWLTLLIPEIVAKKKKCSVCDKEISLRNPCGHISGEVYNGKMCNRVVTEFDLLGIALVENPENKYAVMFTTDPETKEQIDQYNYYALEYLFCGIKSPYEYWDLEISQRYHSHNEYMDVGRNSKCPCKSGKKYNDCCLKEEGVKYPHYEFILQNPIDEGLLPEI